MAEVAISRRKSQLFLNNISRVIDTHNEVVRKKLRCGKFPQTKTGFLKIFGLSLLLSSIIVCFANQEYDNNTGIVFYIFITCNCLAFIGQLIFIVIFSIGKTARDPEPWIKRDIVFNLIISLISIIIGITSLEISNRNRTTIDKLSEILGISGSGIIIFSCASLFLMYRFIEDPEESNPPSKLPTYDQRKSIFA